MKSLAGTLAAPFPYFGGKALGEHDEVLQHGWHIREWTARKGYAATEEAIENSASETLWCSPACIPEQKDQFDFFAEAA